MQVTSSDPAGAYPGFADTVTCNFGCNAIAGTIKVKLAGFTLSGGTCSRGALIGQTSKGGQTICTGCDVNFRVNTSENLKLYSTYVPSTVTADVTFEEYKEPPVEEEEEAEDGETNDWIEKSVTIDAGINEAVIDYFFSNTLGYGIIKYPGESINSPHIPTVADAVSMCELELNKAAKTFEIDAPVAPMFSAAPGDFATVIEDYRYLDTVGRINGMAFDIDGSKDGFNWKTAIRENNQ